MQRALLVAAALLSSAGATSISEKLAEQPCLLRHHRDRDWALKVTQHQARNHSQYGQDGALQWIYQHIGEKNRFFVEYGFDATNYGGGVGANTHNLYELGWRGVLFDGQVRPSPLRAASLTRGARAPWTAVQQPGHQPAPSVCDEGGRGGPAAQAQCAA